MILTALATMIETKNYSDGHGKQYIIAITLIDAGYNNDLVVQFCENYASSVFPILGRDTPAKNSSIKEFSKFETQLGTVGFKIFVDLYKDRWAAALRKQWSGQNEMPLGHFSAPMNLSDKSLRELTVEYKRARIEKSTGKVLGYEWYRPQGVRNELWDLLIYNSAALELIASDVCTNQMGLEFVAWGAFFDYCKEQQLYFTVDKT